MEKCEAEERDRGHATRGLDARVRGLSCVLRALGAMGGLCAGEEQGQLWGRKTLWDVWGISCRGEIGSQEARQEAGEEDEA